MPSDTPNFVQGQAVVELGFQLDSNSREVTPLTSSQAIVEESALVSEINAPTRHTHLIRTKIPEYVDKLIHVAMQQSSPLIKVRLGIVSGEARVFLPWQDHIITYYSAIPNQGGHTVRLDTHDMMYAIGRVDQRVRARRGKISEIIQSIIQENSSLSKLGSVVEPTQNNGGEIYIQSFITDVDFIISRMLPRAINGKGRGNYRFFIRDNVVHFHSPDYQTEVHKIDFFNRSAGTSLKFSDSSQINIGRGASATTGILYDPYTGASQTIHSDPKKVLNYSKVTSRIDQVSNSDEPIQIHIGANRIDEVIALIQNIHDQAYSSMYECELKMEKMPFIQLNDMVDVVVRPDDVKTSPWTGFYNVVRVEHTIISGAMESKFILQRGEQSTLGRNFQGLKSLGIPDLALNENVAEGEQINFAEIKSSKKTSGQTTTTERVAGGGILKTVQLP